MSPQDQFDETHDYRAQVSPFGVSSQKVKQDRFEQSELWRNAAFNLADKAVRRLFAGEEPAAQRLIDKLVTLPFDEVEEEWPQLLAVDQAIFNVFADEFEYQQDYEARDLEAQLDGEFLDEPEPEVLVRQGLFNAAARADQGAAATLRAAMWEMLSEPRRWGLSGYKLERMTWTAQRLPEGTRARDLPRSLTETELATVIRTHVELAVGILNEFRQ